MRYNSSDKSGLTNKTSRQQDNYMELANACNVVNYFINNSICCFDCREFCRAEYKTYDWLTRCANSRLHTVFDRLEFTHFSHYHRHRRRRPASVTVLSSGLKSHNTHNKKCQDCATAPLSPHQTPPQNSIQNKQRCENSRQKKFHYIQSKKTKYKAWKKHFREYTYTTI